MAYHILIMLSCLLSCSAQLADEMQVYEADCLGEDKMPCIGGGCFWHEQYCDGHIDCADGSDENLCSDHLPDAQLCNETHQYLCEDQKRCIPSTWMCNNQSDCDDDSDEVNCTIPPDPAQNATCQGFLCGSGECISPLWPCDGRYDCIDESDEQPFTCRHAHLSRQVDYLSKCQECVDSSLCLLEERMCDGMRDCRDGSDEGPFCSQWQTMCVNVTCGGNATCRPQRDRAVCLCPSSYTAYNYTTHTCEDVNDCADARPKCSHMCENGDGHFKCHCDPGYTEDMVGYLCYAPDPEAMLFFSTRNDIKYLKIKTRQLVTVASGIKQAHGVSYDGKYLYWVETAEGHESIVRAHLDNVEESKEVIVGLGLEDPGDVAVDWLGGHIYFSDAERGVISACRTDGSMCTTIKTDTRLPKFVTLDPKNGTMYWADWHGRPVIMRARMDGSAAQLLTDGLHAFASGLALDVPNGRLYFVDKTVRVIKLDDGKVYNLFHQPVHRPYAVAVFENTVFWSDWASDTIQAMDKIHDRYIEPYKLDSPVYGMHIYHPILMESRPHPCSSHNCSHFCFLSSNETHSCACPEGMELHGTECQHVKGYRPQYLVVAGGAIFTRVQYNALGNPETHATNFDIGRVQAMAYDTLRDTLYMYDALRKSINYVPMSEFSLGVTTVLLDNGLDNVLDMDYDYVSDCLYILEGARRSVEAVSLRTRKRALVHRFDNETPISLCVLPDYGRMLVAVSESEQNNELHVDSIGLDGADVQHLLLNNLKGPHVRLKYAHNLDNVYIADEGYGVIDFIHPQGTGRENFVELSTTVTSLAATDNYVFWTDRRTSRLYWSDVHEHKPKIRRMRLSIFPNYTHLHIQATSPFPDKHVPLSHPCDLNPCSDVCVQTARTPRQGPSTLMQEPGFKCLCPSGLLNVDGKCTELVKCGEDERYCHNSNECFRKSGICDGKKDCQHGEDEEDCPDIVPSNSTSCAQNEYLCYSACIPHNHKCLPPNKPEICSTEQFECVSDAVCIERSQMCDARADCPDASDEAPSLCHTLNCLQTEFMCASGHCILATFRCDGEPDCVDNSDEVECLKKTCPQGNFQCRSSECVALWRRCDKQVDCLDGSDEADCGEPDVVEPKEEAENCAVWEDTCEMNRSICIPLTARCNGKTDCPGGTDETGCANHCSYWGFFQCKQENRCVPKRMVCDGRRDCSDGSEETPDACDTVNRTSRLYPAPLYPREECHDGFQCGSGECIEWRAVCDVIINCRDGSDEGGLCSTACENNTCSHHCTPTPSGALCRCPAGYRLHADGRTCTDLDECINDVCSQLCHNVPGSFLCACHHGYALRSDRRSCKATKGSMAVLYVSGNSVRSMTADGLGAVMYYDDSVTTIADMDVDVRNNKLYVTSVDAGKLIEVNSTEQQIVVTKIGRPTKVAVDWITGNVYFVDSSPSASCVRVCNLRRKRCAKLQKLPSNSQVTSLVVDPASRRMFYCISQGLEWVVWSASLSGQQPRDLADVGNCTGLAVDSFKRRLYVAETGPARVVLMDFERNVHDKVITNDPHLQSPHGLAIFEDHVYFLVANSFKLNRCALYGQKRCELYLQRMVDANTFAIRHQSVQRDDLKNECEGDSCDGVCVLGETGAQCLCADGSITRDGRCASVDKSELPLFNGWSFPDYVRTNSVSVTLISGVLTLFTLYLAVFLYYHFVHRKRKGRTETYMPVHFQNSMTEEMQGLTIASPTLEMPPLGGNRAEFSNPLQFFRDMWSKSFSKSTRPIGTAQLEVDVPHLLDVSDTESDKDDKENKPFIIGTIKK